MKKYGSKILAKKAVVELGYTIHFFRGKVAGFAHGSREYYMKPDAPLNEFDFPISKYAVISRAIGNFWTLSEFKTASVKHKEK